MDRSTRCPGRRLKAELTLVVGLVVACRCAMVGTWGAPPSRARSRPASARTRRRSDRIGQALGHGSTCCERRVVVRAAIGVSTSVVGVWLSFSVAEANRRTLVGRNCADLAAGRCRRRVGTWSPSTSACAVESGPDVETCDRFPRTPCQGGRLAAVSASSGRLQCCANDRWT